ncbi:hypothetical protein PIB30_074456, partial [Stylosanthes scabra]|nr:hypothetical protein [Stylosanthes scabra]
MSRICVKNIPKYATEDRLREFFSEKGEITDVKLMRTKDGKSRQFAFIGFRSEHEAQEAIQYFNRSYLDTCRITCEEARKRGDADLPRPWSRHSASKESKVTSDVKEHARPKEQGQVHNSEDIDDPELQEFLQVMQPRAKSKLWANDTSNVSTIDEKQKVSKKGSKDTSVANPADSDHSDSSSDQPSNHEDDKSCETKGNEIISDMDYFKSRVTKDWSDSESDDKEDDGDNDSVSTVDNDQENDANPSEGEENVDKKSSKISQTNGAKELNLKGQPDATGEDIAQKKSQVNSDVQGSQFLNSDDKKEVFESCRLFVRNLPYTTTEEELEEHFSKIGSVSQVHLVVDKSTKRSKGIAYILYAFPEFAARALEELDNSIFQGRLLHVMPAIQRPSENKESKDQGVKTLKQKREEEKKAAEASGDTRAWNSLFMRPDTVVENIARKYGVSKSDLLDREADDLAVRIALGETQVISDTKKAFTNAGVNVELLEALANGKVDGLKRSNHVLLVKNLPYGSTENELSKMFGKFGSLDKIILPPTKTLALVVFLEAAEARAAFRGLAYKRYKDAPLYLEWAPFDILSQSTTSRNNELNTAVGENDAKRVMLEQHVQKISEDIDPDRVEGRSLFVKNLNFKTTDESLKKHFIEHVKEGKILSVKVKKHLKNGKNVS